MEYVYAALILNETDAEINEENITATLEAAGVDVEESRVKALVAALEDVDIEEAIETAAAAPAPAAGSAGGEVETADDDDEEEAAEEEAAEEEDEDDEADGEGLGALFG
ncbi:50S ribosomal protein P1 [Haloferax namakaokahaiae]|uniref:Large ribosomal subunit protein P1 n=1 Tax=Haloferax namakaokahaiae TaxID=1748331 RepID=A0ABD5ZA36_9EURY